MDNEYIIGLDSSGAPVLVDKQPKDGTNDAPVGKEEPVPSAPENPEASTRQGRPDLWRRRDAVVDAARTLDDLSVDGVRDFVRQRWSGTKVLEDADIETFSRDARQQRVEDVVDALDHRVRHGVFGRARVAHVSLPRGWARRELRAMSDDDVKHVVERLRGRGWTADQVKRHVVRALDDDQRRLASALDPPVEKK